MQKYTQIKRAVLRSRCYIARRAGGEKSMGLRWTCQARVHLEVTREWSFDFAAGT